MKDIWHMLEQRAQHSELIKGSRHSAALIYRKRVISWGNNSLKTHPIMLKYGRCSKSIYLHAEIDAMVKGINLHGVDFPRRCTLCVLGVNNAGKIINSSPCSGCQRAIEAFSIKKVEYT